MADGRSARRFTAGLSFGVAAPDGCQLPLERVEGGVLVGIDTVLVRVEAVAAAGGRTSPKYLIANRALEGITRQLQAFITNTAAGPRQVSAALIVFTGEGAREAVPFGPFDAPAFLSWSRSFKQPDGGTPLGRALTKASDVVPLLIAAMGITLVSLTDTIATATSFAARRGEEVEPPSGINDILERIGCHYQISVVG